MNPTGPQQDGQATPARASSARLDTVTAEPAWELWLTRQGEMGARVAEFDWASTPLGPLSEWPAELRSAASLCLGSHFPMSVRWGRELIVLYNDACRDVYGPARFADALGRPSAEVWSEAGAAMFEHLASILEDGTSFLAVDELVPLDRTVPLEECYFTFAYTPIVDDDGRPVGVHSTFIETTDALLAGRRLEALVELGRELSSARTQDEAAEAAARALSRNPMDHPCGAIYRIPEEQGEACAPVATFGAPDVPTETRDVVEACVRTGQPQHVPGEPLGGWHAYPARDPEQEEATTHVLVLGQPRQRPWEEGLASYFGLVASTLGAAMLAQAEQQVERRRVSRLAALDAAKSAFFAGVSHELRTPLALISAPVDDVLEREVNLSEESQNSLALVQANVSRLTRMVQAMLDFSRMEAGRLVPNLEPVDVSVLASGLASSFAGAFERAGLEFTVVVPTIGRPALLDRDFFERIVSNLLTNALKYTPEGSVSLTLTELPDADAYEVEVSDTGLGIEPDDHERVFARFERLAPKAGARSSSGAGIGLAMVRQLTGLLDGEVRLDSTPGEGSTFTVRLPFTPSRPAGVAGSSITPRSVQSFLSEIDTWTNTRAVRRRTVRPDAPRLLIAEDDPALAGFLADAFHGDYRVDVVPDGRQALEALRDHPVDLVLTDLTMPDLDGLSLIREIRTDADLRELPVVLLSSTTGDQAASVGLDVGADDYVAKPFSMIELRSRLAANLVRARQRSADSAWRRAILASLRDPFLIFDDQGGVIELNEAFTDLFGYSLADGPLRPPYPWWPTENEDAETLAKVMEVYRGALANRTMDAELVLYTSDRRPVWVHSTGSTIVHPYAGGGARIRILRDITREKQAQRRRAAAAQVSSEFGRADDLATLLGVAEYGFEVLFDGTSTIQLDADESHLFASGGSVSPEDLHPSVTAGLAGSPSADTVSRRPGILLVPQSTSAARAWVQFPRPRRIGTDEMIAADLLAQAFGLAVDRLLTMQQAADRETNLQVAMESHRLIGQAVGILVERHRLRPAEAFEKLKEASQNRNVKLREIAVRVIESGLEPDRA